MFLFISVTKSLFMPSDLTADPVMAFISFWALDTDEPPKDSAADFVTESSLYLLKLRAEKLPHIPDTALALEAKLMLAKGLVGAFFSFGTDGLILENLVAIYFPAVSFRRDDAEILGLDTVLYFQKGSEFRWESRRQKSWVIILRGFPMTAKFIHHSYQSTNIAISCIV